MVRLKNIEIDNNIISYTLPAGFEWCKSHVHHAKKYLLSNLKEILRTPIHDKIVMWY